MNYIQHNKELDGALYKPEKPVIFTKADSALLKDHKPFFIPDWSEQVDYETELVVRICRLGKTSPPVTCSARPVRRDCPGKSARVSTARQ